MREARIKIPPAHGEAVYHCMSRTVNGEWLFDAAAKEILRRQMWQVAEFCGVGILTYTIMSNHFHVLVRVPRRGETPDGELLRRYRILYPGPTRHQLARLDVIESELSGGGALGIVWRKRQLALMGDVSQFMKLLKERFSIWFNKSHDRFGPLWADRFKSVLVDPNEGVLQTIAAYIDLNCVRAGLTTDPKEYRFCGYAEAVAGNKAAQAGIRGVIGGRAWWDVQADYRQILFGTGAGGRMKSARIPMAEFRRVIAAGGKLPLVDLLRCRVKFFTGGAVLGSRAFVQAQIVSCRTSTRKGKGAPHVLPPWGDWSGWATLHGMRQAGVG